jgi:hypothetical protein
MLDYPTHVVEQQGLVWSPTTLGMLGFCRTSGTWVKTHPLGCGTVFIMLSMCLIPSVFVFVMRSVFVLR